jgi:hypothetical protein
VKSASNIPTTEGRRITKEFSKQLILVCEGPDDARFYETLIKKRGLPDFEVIPVQNINGQTGGLGGFEPSMRAIQPWTSLRVVKLLVLAADNESGVLSILKRALRDNAFDYPKKSAQLQYTTRLGKPSTAIVLLPTKGRGDLETLCLPMLYLKWPKARACVRAYLKCSRATTASPRWTPSNLDKARIHAVIAGFNRQDPEKILRDCFQGGLIDLNHNTFDAIADLIKRLGTTKL